MTNRTRELDHRVMRSFPGEGDFLTGLYQYKQQGGTNSPADHYVDNDYNMLFTEYNDPPCMFHNASDVGTPNRVRPVFSAFGPHPLIDLSWSDEELNSHVIQMAAKVRGSEFNAAIAIGEGPKALRMIENSALGVYKALRSVKRLDFNALKKQFGAPSKRYDRGLGDFTQQRNLGAKMTSLWLEFTYGWKPLLNDVDQGLRTLEALARKPIEKKYVLRRSKRADLFDWHPTHDIWLYSGAVARSRRRLALHMSAPPSAAELTGFTNPASVAWELLPYSFVIDWFVPVGNYLQALGEASILEGKWVDTIWYYARTSGIKPGSGYDVCQSQNDYTTLIQMSRVVTNSPPIVMPSMTPLSEAISWQRAVSALSLLNNFDLRL